MYTSIDICSCIINSPGHLNSETIIFLPQTVSTGNELAGTEVTKVLYEFVRCFEFQKLPSSPGEADLK